MTEGDMEAVDGQAAVFGKGERLPRVLTEDETVSEDKQIFNDKDHRDRLTSTLIDFASKEPWSRDIRG